MGSKKGRRRAEGTPAGSLGHAMRLVTRCGGMREAAKTIQAVRDWWAQSVVLVCVGERPGVASFVIVKPSLGSTWVYRLAVRSSPSTTPQATDILALPYLRSGCLIDHGERRR